MAVGIAFLVLSKVAPARMALWAAAIFAFATPTWSVSADALWTHGPNQFWLLLGLLGLASSHPGRAGFAAAGTAITRPHMVVGWAIGALYQLARTRRPMPVMVFALTAAMGSLLLVLYNGIVFGHFNVLGGYSEQHLQAGGVGPLVFVVNVLGSLISPHRGVLLLTPFLWLLLPGLPGAWRVAPVWVRSAAVSGAAYALVQLYLIRFIGGHGFFSYRTMIEPLTFALPLFVLAYQSWTCRTKGRQASFALLVVLAASFHAFGAIFDQHHGESGNPFRVFSGFAVASEVGPVVTGLWLALTVLACWYVPIRVLRVHISDPTMGHVGDKQDDAPAGSRSELPPPTYSNERSLRAEESQVQRSVTQSRPDAPNDDLMPASASRPASAEATGSGREAGQT